MEPGDDFIGLSARIQRLIAGGFFVIGIFLAGQHLAQDGTAVKDGLLWQSLFLGFGMGHYMGLGFTKDETHMRDVLIGAFVVISGITLFNLMISPLSGTIIFLAISLLLFHTSGVVENKEYVETLVNWFAGRLAVFYLSIYIVGFQLIPLLEYIGVNTAEIPILSNKTTTSLIPLALWREELHDRS